MGKNKIYIRVDGGSKIGLGHVVRCMALASMLKEHFSIHFISKELPKTISTEIKKGGFSLQLITTEEELFSILSEKDIVVLDQYSLDSEYQRRIKKMGCKLVCIDDLNNQVFYADLIINHAPGFSPEDYKAQDYTQYALGLDFALLRPSFLKQAKNRREINDINSLLICFGGADYKNLTEYSYQQVSGDERFNRIKIVVGSAYSFSDELRHSVRHDKRVSVYSSVDENKMLSLMLGSDMAIVPASGVLYEVLATRIIPVSGYFTENQKEFYKQFKALGAFYDARDFSVLKEKINESFRNISAYKPRIFIDGLSGIRIQNLFIELDNR